MGTTLIPCSGHYLPLIVYSNAKSVEIPSIYMILAPQGTKDIQIKLESKTELNSVYQVTKPLSQYFFC